MLTGNNASCFQYHCPTPTPTPPGPPTPTPTVPPQPPPPPVDHLPYTGYAAGLVLILGVMSVEAFEAMEKSTEIYGTAWKD